MYESSAHRTSGGRKGGGAFAEGGYEMNHRSYSPFYFIRSAFSGLFRNFGVTLGAVLVLICCLVLMGSFYALIANISVNLDELSLLNKIVVFLEYDATDEDAARIEKEIKDL